MALIVDADLAARTALALADARKVMTEGATSGGVAVVNAMPGYPPGTNMTLAQFDASPSLADYIAGTSLAILAHAGAGGVALSDVTPAPLGTASPGDDALASRADHVHAHGTQAGGTLHADATGSVSGFMPAADKAKLDGIPAGGGAQVNYDVPLEVSNDNNPGSSAFAARVDHEHAHGTHVGGYQHSLASSLDNGFMSSADKDKLDGIPTGGGGVALGTGTPSTVTSGSGYAGAALDAAPFDHAHSHGNLLGNSLHAAATTGANGFMSSTDKSKLDGIGAGALPPVLIGGNTPSAIVSVGGDPGTAFQGSRNDHTHAHGSLTGGSLHAAATTSVNGFMSAADKLKLDGLSTGGGSYGSFATLSLASGWSTTSGSRPAASRTEPGNVVRLRGTVTSSSGSTSAAFTLPSGQRPTTFPVVLRPGAPGNGNVSISIATTGVVTISGQAASIPISLEGLTFTTDS